MPIQPLDGTLTVHAVSEDELVMDERFAKGDIPNGIVRMHLDSNGNLKCEWLDGPRAGIIRSRATFCK
jgi:hypothetical protein